MPKPPQPSCCPAPAEPLHNPPLSLGQFCRAGFGRFSAWTPQSLWHSCLHRRAIPGPWAQLPMSHHESGYIPLLTPQSDTGERAEVATGVPHCHHSWGDGGKATTSCPGRVPRGDRTGRGWLLFTVLSKLGSCMDPEAPSPPPCPVPALWGLQASVAWGCPGRSCRDTGHRRGASAAQQPQCCAGLKLPTTIPSQSPLFRENNVLQCAHMRKM